MANRIMLNQTSYHGAGAIEEIVNEAKAHARMSCGSIKAVTTIFEPALIRI